MTKIEITPTDNSIKILISDKAGNKELHFTSKQSLVTGVSKLVRLMFDLFKIGESEFNPAVLGNKKGYIKPVEKETQKESVSAKVEMKKRSLKNG